MDTSTPLNPGDLFSANGQIIVITGGGSGIGQAIASALNQAGASGIYILSRRLSALTETASSQGDPVIPIECDVTSPSSISTAVLKIEQETGYIDVLISNAGMQGPNHRPANDTETLDELQSILLSKAED